MKKYNLLKVIGITVILTWLITLFIPGSQLGYTGEITKSAIASNGIWGLFSNLNISISYFNGIAVFLIAIACFYAVLNKLPVYERFVNKVVSIFKEKKGLLVSITIVTFGILALFVSDIMVLMVFVPFIYQVMKGLEIDKKVILSSTIISSFIGAMNAIYNDTLFSSFELKINTLLLYKVIVFVLSIVVLLFFIVPKKEVKKQSKITTKNSKKKETVKKIETKKSNNKEQKVVRNEKRNNIIFGILTVLFTLFVIAAVIPWESLINNFKAFTDFNAWLSSLKINGYAVFSNIIGSPIQLDATTGSSTGVLNILGNWSITDISILLFIVTAIIALVARLKFNEFIESVTSAIKRILPIAITAMLISIVLVIMVTTGVNITISNAIISITKGFNIATATLASIVGSVLTADFYYFVTTVGSVFKVAITDTNVYGILGFIMQNVYNLMMIVAPTSVGLIIGLYFLNIPYDKWFKFIWKVLLSLFIIVIVTSIIIFAQV